MVCMEVCVPRSMFDAAVCVTSWNVPPPLLFVPPLLVKLRWMEMNPDASHSLQKNWSDRHAQKTVAYR